MARNPSITVRILGDPTGFQAASAATNRSLVSIGNAARATALLGGAALVGLGIAAVKLGTDFQDAKNDIAIATGATGEALDQLFGEAKDVLGTVPASMDEVAAATGAVSTQLGLTGDALEGVTRLGVEFSEVLGSDVGETADSAARIMNQFGVNAGDADDFFGDLLQTAQDFGVDAPALLSDMEKMGPALQSIGLEADGAAAFLGLANQAGVDVTRLKSPMLQFADAAIAAGEDPAAAFAEFTEQAAGLTDQTDLLALANETFGTTGGAAIAELVEAGVPLGDLNDVLGDNTGLVGDTAEATRNWTDKLSILKNRVLVKLEPVLAAVVDFIDDSVVPAIEQIAEFLERNVPAAVEVFQREVLPPIQAFAGMAQRAFQSVVGFFERSWPQIQAVASTVFDAIRYVITDFSDFFERYKPIILGVGTAIAVGLVAAFVSWAAAAAAAAAATLIAIAPVVAIGVAIAALVAGLVWAYENVEAFRVGVDASFQYIRDEIVPIVVGIVEGIVEMFQGLIDFFVGVFTGDWGRAWEGITGIFSGWWAVMTGVIDLAWERIQFAVGAIISGVQLLWNWDFLGSVVSGAVDAVVGFFVGLPGRLAELLTDIASAGGDIGSSLIQGMIDAISGAVGFVTDFASGIGLAMIAWINNNVIDWINDRIPDKIAIDFAPDINLPDDPIPHIPSFHTGGPVGVLGGSARDVPAVLQTGEYVLSRNDVSDILTGRNRQAPLIGEVTVIDGRDLNRELARAQALQAAI